MPGSDPLGPVMITGLTPEKDAAALPPKLTRQLADEPVKRLTD